MQLNICEAMAPTSPPLVAHTLSHTQEDGGIPRRRPFVTDAFSPLRVFFFLIFIFLMHLNTEELNTCKFMIR